MMDGGETGNELGFEIIILRTFLKIINFMINFR